MNRSIFLALLALVGCQPAQEHEPSRLERVQLYADDGTIIDDGWFDTELDARCTMWTLPAGETRCYPAAMPAYMYRDARCSRPVAVHFPTCGSVAPDFVTVDSNAPCEPSRYHRRGEPVRLSSVYRSSDEACIRQAAANGAVYYELGEHLPLVRFVGANRSR